MYNVSLDTAWSIIHGVWDYMMTHGINLQIGGSPPFTLTFGVIAIGVVVLDIVGTLISHIWWGE